MRAVALPDTRTPQWAVIVDVPFTPVIEERLRDAGLLDALLDLAGRPTGTAPPPDGEGEGDGDGAGPAYGSIDRMDAEGLLALALNTSAYDGHDDSGNGHGTGPDPAGPAAHAETEEHDAGR